MVSTQGSVLPSLGRSSQGGGQTGAAAAPERWELLMGLLVAQAGEGCRSSEGEEEISRFFSFGC